MARKTPPKVEQVRAAVDVASTPAAKSHICEALKPHDRYKPVVAALRDSAADVGNRPWNTDPVTESTKLQFSNVDSALTKIIDGKVEIHIAITDKAALQRAYKSGNTWLKDTDPLAKDSDRLVHAYLAAQGFKCEKGVVRDNNGKLLSNEDRAKVLNPDNFNKFMLKKTDNLEIKLVPTESAAPAAEAQNAPEAGA